ncbi:hypothetical protein BEWA_000440 [Theileria equi strain WA]|uniref:Uncharacterized protein n=1 Tax=Theileria equi strain WA TaxID=1537102 RepID=L0B0H7_THEEQ|nr:hypothetical protein BEWA_000440 [Theileria equi strain WA]AFZ80639.1 hypothetical protein BEWA_000440 [Theileria equi strain WA]|eukprot:XP_004830305.1 hypothetical protein BEWA_000440 [Theileria equi strain WA]
MLQFLPQDSRESEWFESTNKDGTQWAPVTGNTGGFYVSDLPTEKLDEVACSIGIGVIADLTRDKHPTGNSYCCGKKHDGQKVSVSVGSGSVASKIPYFRRHIGGGTTLSGIKYYYNGNRRSITGSELSFPIYGPVSVYTFYCTGKDPKLICIKYEDRKVNKWFKQRNSNTWEEVFGISKDPENIKDCKDDDFRQLVDALGCGIYSTCSDSSAPTPSLSSSQKVTGAAGPKGPVGPAGNNSEVGQDGARGPEGPPGPGGGGEEGIPDLTGPGEEPATPLSPDQPQPVIGLPIATILTGVGTYGGAFAGAGGLTGFGWWMFKR